MDELHDELECIHVVQAEDRVRHRRGLASEEEVVVEGGDKPRALALELLEHARELSEGIASLRGVRRIPAVGGRHEDEDAVRGLERRHFVVHGAREPTILTSYETLKCASTYCTLDQRERVVPTPCERKYGESRSPRGRSRPRASAEEEDPRVGTREEDFR